MNVTREVVQDLLALDLAGEASADSRALIEEYLAGDPELAREAAAARSAAVVLPPAPAAAPEAEKRALERTRSLLKSRSSTLAVAAIFTVLPLSFSFDESGVTWWLIRDDPKVGIAWWATAAAMWIAHFVVRRRLRATGL